MQHFYERLERENDYQYEYEKLEFMVYKESIQSPYSCLYEVINLLFRKWEKRGNYISFDEMRKAAGLENDFSIATGQFRASV